MENNISMSQEQLNSLINNISKTKKPRIVDGSVQKKETQAELVSRLCETICSKDSFLTLKDVGDIYRWNGIVWENSGENTLKQIIETITNDASKFIKNEVIDKIKCKTFTDRSVLNNHKSKIALLNCVLDLDTGETQPHSKELHQTIYLPIEYNPDATCPITDKFVHEVMEGMPELYYEMIAYCLVSDYRFKKFFILLGSKDTGKTTVVEGLHSFLGKKNITGMSLQELAENKFSKANLYGKLANICDDLPRVDINDVGQLKQLTGGSPQYAEKKMVQSRVEFTNTAKLIFTTNKIPKTKGADEAFYGRIIIIPCTKIITDIDPELPYKLASKEELSGLLNKVLKYRKMILHYKKFSYTNDLSEVTRMYNIGSLDNVASYQYERVSCDEDTLDDIVTKDEIYGDYVGYCRNKNTAPNDPNAFHRRLQELVQGIFTIRLAANDQGERHYAYRGMRIK